MSAIINPSGGGAPVGSSGQVLYNNSGVITGMSGTSWDDTNRSLTLTGATVTASHPVLDLSQTWNNGAVIFTGLKFNVTNTASAAASLLLDLQVGGTSKFAIDKTGNIINFNSWILGGDANFTFNRGGTNWIALRDNLSGLQGISVGSTGFFSWTSTADAYAGVDTFLARDAAGILAQRNSTNAQTLRVYNTYTDASNYERGVFDWTTTANTLTIGTQKAGTGSTRNVQIVTAGGLNITAAPSDPVFAQPYIGLGDLGSVTTVTLMSISGGLGVGRLGNSDEVNVGYNNDVALPGVAVRSTGFFAITQGTFPYTGTSSGSILTAPAAAKWQLGLADAAAPVAQTLQVQSVVAGTTNTAGTDWTFVGSKGTGTGAGGNIIFQTAAAASSGTSQNSASTVLTLNNIQNAVFSKFIQWGGQARVTSDFSKTSDTTLANVTGLSVSVAAGRTYSFEAYISFTCAAAGGIQAAIAGTATATAIEYDGYIVDSAANGIKGNTQATALGTAVATATTTGTAGVVHIFGTITVNAAGTLTVQMAQNTSNGTATVAKRGSYFIVHDMP